MIVVNTVLQNKLDDSKVRVIYLDSQNDIAYYVKLEGDTAMPILTTVSYLCSNDNYIKVKEPWNLFLTENEIPEKNKIRRDKNWLIIDELWNQNKHEFLIKKNRRELIKKYSEKSRVSERQIKRLLSRFFQKGMIKNALLSEYMNSGGKGQVRSSNGKKRGRPRTAPLFNDDSIGINVDVNVRTLFQQSIKKYYNKKKKAPLKHAYEMMLMDNYSDVYFENGVKKYLLWGKDRIPTYRQFEYWFNKDKDVKDVFVKRNSEKEYMLKLRELMGTSNMETFGPGFRYQIDATVADVYLLSSLNRKHIVGRPILYAVIDVYSRMVVGIYVGLEGPSWIGAMLALDNVLEDKVEFCKKYGVITSSAEWPNSLLPETIIADRGEFEGYNVNNMINNLNITVENTAPYRGDLKGIVERRFRVYNGRIKHMVPGAIAKQYRERGDKDYRLDAIYTLEDFTAFILESTIEHNNSIIEKYESEKKLIADEVPALPVEIWKWGLKNRRCAFVLKDREYVRMNLLPRGKALLTRKGIRYNKAYYASKTAIKEQWYLSNVKRTLDIVYDPYNMSSLYLMIQNGYQVEFEECFLTEGSEEKYSDLSFEQMRFMNELQQEINNSAEMKAKQNTLNRKANIIHLTKETQEKVPSTNKSDSERLRNVLINRKVEKRFHRGDKIFDSEDDALFEEHLTNDEEIKEKPISRLDLLVKKRDEKRGKSK